MINNNFYYLLIAEDALYPKFPIYVYEITIKAKKITLFFNAIFIIFLRDRTSVPPFEANRTLLLLLNIVMFLLYWRVLGKNEMDMKSFFY